MSGMFSKPKSPSLPPVPPPAAIPERAPEAEDWQTKLAKRRSGFQKTILAGSLESAQSKGKKLLGGE